MTKLKQDQYGQFQKVPKESWNYIAPENRTGEEQIKYPLPLINPENPAQSVTAQASGCTNCKDATCSSLGCSMGKDIGSANITLAAAGNAANKAFALLKKHSSQGAEDYIRELNVIMMTPVPDFTALEEKLFSRLREFDAPAADQYQKKFERFMFEAFQIFEEGGGRGDVYGLACPAQSVLCESKCQIQFGMARGITIPMNEKAIYEFAWSKNWVQPVKPAIEREESVAIIGSGAASTHLALELRKKGYQVTVFEKNTRIGELGDGKILSYKVPHEVWAREHQRLIDSGIKFELGTPIGKNGKPFAQLSQDFNAVALCTGTPFAREPAFKGDAANEVLLSNAVLKHSQDALYRKKFLGQDDYNIPAEYDMRNKDVVINGHGDTAVDCARDAIAKGASSVTLVSRHEKINARDDKGADKAAFKELIKEAGDRLKFQNDTALESVDKSGNAYILRGQTKDGVKIEIKAGAVISAIGNITGNLKEIFALQTLPTTKAGTVEIQLPALSAKSEANGVLSGFVGVHNETPVFAAGEIVTNGSLLVTAGKGGIDLAPMIDSYLKNPKEFHGKIETQSGKPAFRMS